MIEAFDLGLALLDLDPASLIRVVYPAEVLLILRVKRVQMHSHIVFGELAQSLWLEDSLEHVAVPEGCLHEVRHVGTDVCELVPVVHFFV